MAYKKVNGLRSSLKFLISLKGLGLLIPVGINQREREKKSVVT